MKNSNRALLVISAAVFLASSTWFSGTAAAPVLRQIWNLDEVRSSWLTISVQLGFIFGTLLYAVLNLADIFRARRVFFVSAFLGAFFNAGFALVSRNFGFGLSLRFLTGLTLAGVYPVGMKIIAQWFRENLGWRLGVMVGALTLGTAVPYFLFAVGPRFDWKLLMLTASALSVSGGLLVLFGVGDGPFLMTAPRFDARAAFRIFRIKGFREQAFGYFGHMWELYAFWSLSSSYLAASFAERAPQALGSVPMISFSVIGIGILGCVLGGWNLPFCRGTEGRPGFPDRVFGLLRAVVVLVPVIARDSGAGGSFLGHRRYIRLSAVLSPGGRFLPPRIYGNGSHDSKRHRLRDHGRLDPAYRLAVPGDRLAVGVCLSCRRPRSWSHFYGQVKKGSRLSPTGRTNR